MNNEVNDSAILYFVSSITIVNIMKAAGFVLLQNFVTFLTVDGHTGHTIKFLEANLIADIVESMGKPTIIIAKTCWPLSQKNYFHSALGALNRNQVNMIQFIESKEIVLNPIQNQQTVILVDLNCNNIDEFLEMSYKENLFRTPFRWILIPKTGNESDLNEEYVPKEIKTINILLDIEVLIASKIDEETYDLYFVYKISSESKWIMEQYGIWSVDTGLTKSISLTAVVALRRLDLDGYEIPICYVLTDNDSINHLTDDVNDHIDTITKVNFPTTNQLLDFLNANRKYVFSETWGYRVNNTWNGMTGYLVRGEVEIGGSPMFFTSERMSIVEYISSPTPTRSKFVFQQPKLSYENNLFLLSFRTNVWYSSLALIFLMFLVIFIVTAWEWKRSHQLETTETDNDNSGILRPNIADIIILIFGATCQQGSPVELKGVLGRIVMLILFLTVMFLYTSYSANIVALLQSSSSKIRTLEDLLNSRLKFGVHDNVFNRYYFSTATEPVRRAIYQIKVAPPNTKPRFMTMDEGVKKMKKGLFAFHMETGVGYKFVGKYFEEGEKCNLKEIQYLQVIDPWLAVRKNTPYLELFKLGTKRLQEHGLQRRENRLLYEKRPKCSGREANFVSVSMVDCYPALLVLSYGTLLALFFLALEILVHKKHTFLTKIRNLKPKRVNDMHSF